mgnify:CR=1 FL=1
MNVSITESRAETKKIEMETRNELCTQFEGQLIEVIYWVSIYRVQFFYQTVNTV